MNIPEGLTAAERLNYGEMKLDELLRNGGSKSDRVFWLGYVDGARRAMAVEAERSAPLRSERGVVG